MPGIQIHNYLTGRHTWLKLVPSLLTVRLSLFFQFMVPQAWQINSKNWRNPVMWNVLYVTRIRKHIKICYYMQAHNILNRWLFRNISDSDAKIYLVFIYRIHLASIIKRRLKTHSFIYI